MADKVPVKATFDANGDADGLAEFQSGETVGYSHGGTGLSALGTSGQVIKVNAGADGLEWGTIAGDIEGVTAGTGLSGGGVSGTVTVNFDPNSLSAGTVNVAADSISIIDADDSGNPKKESIADLATAMADGTTVTATNGVLSASGGVSLGLVIALS